MVKGDQGILKLIEDGWETLISLKLHINNIQATMHCLQQTMERMARNNSESDRILSQQEQGSTEVRRPLTIKLPRLTFKNFDEIRSNEENSGVDLKQRYIKKRLTKFTD
ncbi:Uncharacterized protein BM_BM8238 [Brugia malayi]|uniref:Bm8238 n=1 Tax=Brugia malayi TaxID=6279 RepID=A0A0J9YBQ5_BRUMA|nr:Uncharacterized protein BM_BM8238 [Brugia malayi]CDQ06563.1 Bm8238 [Brugia malayi]VIP00354.1 Uncharacterized protein BM_BM8238 [Brugia malayi]